MSLPKEITDNKFNAEAYFKPQYPDTTNCVLLDAQIGLIGKDIANLYSTDYFQSKKVWKALGVTQKAIRDSGIYLEKLKLEKENKSITLDCRNQIELKRQLESAGIFDNQAEKSDKTVLTQTRNKQIAFAAVGGLLLVGTLFILMRRS